MKILFVSLGCDKNLVDTEKLLGGLISDGHRIVDDETEAEAAVINTCCFIHDAKMESIETVLSIAELKKTASLKYLVVMGCLAERFRADILDEIPEVDAVIGTGSYKELPSVLQRLENQREEHIVEASDFDRIAPLETGRFRADINHYSYLKIAEGCDKFCTYCVIPSIKGRYVSYDFDKLVAEAEELAMSGVNELMVIAQETTLYGTDKYGQKRLPELLKRLCRIEGLDLIRLMYCYPEEITDELIEIMSSEPKICHYIDLPIQHASDTVLKRMGRRTDKSQICSIISHLRLAMPDICIRTSLITGFPGETEEEHSELLDFIREMKLDRVGVFTYSKEDDTPAARMKGQIKASVKKRRQKELMLAQQQIVFEKNSRYVGRIMKTVVDGRIPEENIYVGRTYMDAPGVDGCVFIKSDRELISGSIIDIHIDDFKDYDLIATEWSER